MVTGLCVAGSKGGRSGSEPEATEEQTNNGMGASGFRKVRVAMAVVTGWPSEIKVLKKVAVMDAGADVNVVNCLGTCVSVVAEI